MKTTTFFNTRGFTFVELMIAVAILGIIAAIAAPMYRGYISNAKQSAAKAVVDQMPVLVETYRADNGMMCPGCNAGGPYPIYTYSENNDGSEIGVGNPLSIRTHYPDFKPKGATQTTASLYHYTLDFNTLKLPCTTLPCAVITASPQVGRGAPAGDISSNGLQ
jgi:prepilin-type N-terminal cleavage/methylation domain-containing protein